MGRAWGLRHLAVLAAGGLGTGGRRRWSSVPSWGEGTPTGEALHSSGVQSWLPVPPPLWNTWAKWPARPEPYVLICGTG